MGPRVKKPIRVSDVETIFSLAHPRRQSVTLVDINVLSPRPTLATVTLFPSFFIFEPRKRH